MDLIKQKWDIILNTIQTEFSISDVAINTWFKPLKLHHIDGDNLYLECMESLAVDYMTKKYTSALMTVIEEVTNHSYKISFIGPDAAGTYNKEESNNIIEEVKAKFSNNTVDESGINPKCTFDNFVVGGNSRFAHGAAVAVADNPGESYNPLFIHGGVGLGKTHLMHAIANYIRDYNPNMKIRYVSSEKFTNDLIESLQSSKMDDFRAKYRDLDVLLIDDIQFIIGKESTQNEFFHTFNELRGANKQIVISSDKPPKEMETLEERIRTRFQQGLTADIGQPDYETRMAILRKKIEHGEIEFNDEVIEYIATNFKSNVRELEGALNKLIAYSILTNSEITLDIANDQLRDLINPNEKKELTIQSIIEVVCDHYQISIENILSKKRSTDVALPRMVIMYLASNYTDASQDAIGSSLGGRDHSTVIHGIRKIESGLKDDKDLQAHIEAILKKINPD